MFFSTHTFKKTKKKSPHGLQHNVQHATDPSATASLPLQINEDNKQNESPKLNGRINSLGFLLDASLPPKKRARPFLRNTAFRLSRPHLSLSPTPCGASSPTLLPAEKGFQNSRVYKSGGASTPAPLPTLPPVTLDTK